MRMQGLRRCLAALFVLTGVVVATPSAPAGAAPTRPHATGMPAPAPAPLAQERVRPLTAIGPAVLSGTLSSDTGGGLTGVSLLLISEATGEVVTGHSGPGGTFSLTAPALPAATDTDGYILDLHLPGYLPVSRMITLVPERTERLLQRLVRDAGATAGTTHGPGRRLSRRAAGRAERPMLSPPTCPSGADTWTGDGGDGGDGEWTTAANWSSGVPASSTYACITAEGATVTLDGSETVTGLLLGTGDSLTVAGDSLTLSGTATPSALEGPVTVDAAGALTVDAAATLENVAGGSVAVAGSATVQGTFDQDAGTVSAAAGDNPVELVNGSTLAFTGTGGGAFLLTGSSTDATPAMALSGDLVAGQSLSVATGYCSEGGSTATVNAAGSFTNGGAISFAHVATGATGSCTGGEVALNVPGGDTLTNTGTIQMSGDPSDLTAADTLSGALLNEGTIDVGTTGQPAANLVLGTGATTNDGNLDVAGAATSSDATAGALTVDAGATLENGAGGSLTTGGSVTVEGTFDQDAGTVSAAAGDNPVDLVNGSTLAFTGTGAGAFVLAATASDQTPAMALSGDLVAGQSLSVATGYCSEAGSTVTINAAGSFTNAGAISFAHVAAGATGSCSAGQVALNVPGGDTLTNTGTIQMSGDPSDTTAADTFGGAFLNEGTIDVGPASQPAANLVLASGVTTNDGSLDVAGAATSSDSTAGTLTVDAGATFENGAGGELTIEGSLPVQGTFDQDAGTVSSAIGENPVDLVNGSTLAIGGTGPGAFEVFDSSDAVPTVALSGNLVTDQSLDVEVGFCSESGSTATVNAAGSFTNGGTIVLSHVATGVAGSCGTGDVVFSLPAGDVLTNTGTIDVSGDPGTSISPLTQTFDGGLVNEGTFDIGVAGQPAADCIFSAGSPLTNEGTVDVAAASEVTTNATVTNESGSIVDTGVFSSEAQFIEQAGTTSGGPVEIGFVGNENVGATADLTFQGNGASAFIAPSGAGVDLSGNIAAGQSLTISNSGSNDAGTIVTALGAFTNAGNITFVGATNPAPAELDTGANTVTNTGTIAFTGPGSGEGVDTIDGPLDNGPGATVSVTDGVAASVDGSATNSGTMTVDYGGLTMSGLTNFDSGTGTLTGGTYQVLGTPSQTASMIVGGTVTTLAASLELGAGANDLDYTNTEFRLTQIAAGGTLILDNGVDEGADTLSLVNAGDITLDPSAGLFTASYTQTASGSLTVGVDGEPGTGDFGVLTTAGSVGLAGTLDIAGGTGFVPDRGDVYTFVIAQPLTTITGTFSIVNGEEINSSLLYEPKYSTTSVELVVEAATIDLATESVSGPAVLAVGQAATVHWTVDAVTGSAAGSWTDAVYMSRNMAAGAGAVLLGTAVHSGGIALGDSYQGTLSVTVPGLVPGAYFFVVVADAKDQTADADRANNVGASTAIGVTMTTLAVGATVSGSIPADGDSYVEIDPAAGDNVVVAATFPAASTGALFEAFGRIPASDDYDLAPPSSSSADQSVTIVGAESAPYFIDLDNPTSSAVPYHLSTSETTLAVTSISPVTATYLFFAAEPDVTLTINGIGFTPSSSATLVCNNVSAPPYDNHQVPAESLTYASSTELYADFGPAFSSSGTCNVVVGNGAASAQLAGGLRLNGSSICQDSWYGCQNLGPEVTVTAPAANRKGVDSPAVVTYGNDLPYPVPAPLIELTATGATLHFPGQPVGDGTSVMILGSPSTGDPGVLEPGATGSVTVLFDSTLGGHLSVGFEADTLISPGDTVDWGSLLALYLPAGTPAAVTNYVTAQGGVITGAQMQADLDADATYLSTLGEHVTDATSLIGYELDKIDDFGAMENRYVSGPFGPGLPGIVDTASVDTLGNVTITDTAGNQTTFAPTGSGGLFVAYAGVSSTLSDGPDGGWVMTQPNGSTTTFAANGEEIATTDSSGNVTTYSYSGGELTSITDPAGNEVSYDYNAEGEVTSSTASPGGQVSDFTYDDTGHLATLGSGGSTEDFAWNESANPAVDGTLASLTTADGTAVSYSYDPEGRLTAVTRGDGTTIEDLVYNADNTVTLTDGDGNTTILYPDETGTVVRGLLPDGASASASYNALSEPLTESLDGSTSQYGYDPAGDLTSVTNPLGETTSMGYSGSGVLSSFTEPSGDETTITSNSEGDPTTITAPDGTSSTTDYSAAGLVTSETDRDGAEVGFGYDSSDDLTSESLPGGAVDSFTYGVNHEMLTATDSAGTTTFTYDASGRMTNVTYPSGLGVSYTYDAAGLISTMTTSDGFETTYNYDAAGRLGSISDTSGTLATYTYTDDDQLASVTNANGTSTDYTYDGEGAVESVVNDGPGDVVTSQFTYTHNALGETTAMVDAEGTTTYTYDGAGELTAATLPGGRTLTYSYDDDGNRTATTDTASGAVSYAVNADDEYTSAGATTYTYDADGNLASSTDGAGTTNYTWDAQGQLTGVSSPSGTTTYAYDALGTLISEDVNGTTTNLLTDPVSDTLIGQYDAGDSPIAHYAIGDGVAAQVDPSGGVSSYGFDGSGNVVSLSDPSGSVADSYQYLPFGQVSATGTAPNPFTFGGQFGITSDAGSGFYQDRARYYDPGTGRFVSQDPTMLAGPNPYEYAANDPVDNTDVSGLDTTTIGATVGGFFTGVYWQIVDSATEGTVGGPEATTGQTVGTISGTATSVADSFVNFVSNNAETICETPGLLGDTPMLPIALEGYVQSAEHVLGAVGPALSAINGVINLNKDRLEYNDPSYNTPQYKSASNAIIHLINIPLEIAALGAGGPFAPWAPALIEGGEKAIDIGSKHFFDWTFRPGGWWGTKVQDVFGPKCSAFSQTRTSFDPNEMIGPSGYGSAGFVKGDTPLPYEVFFSNEASASLPAAVVTVTEPLDPSVNLATFSLGSFGFARHVVTPPPGLRSYSVTIDDTAVSGLDVEVAAKLDTRNRTVTWTFTSIDPATGLPPASATAGFLPPDVHPPEGEGFVEYTVTPNASATTGTRISASASVVFDANAPIATGSVTNTIDASNPIAKVDALPAREGAHFTVHWGGSDPGGSGIARYTVIVSDDGAPFSALDSDTTATSIAFTGKIDHTYRFIAQATDNVGNTEAMPTAVQAQTTIVPAPGYLLAAANGTVFAAGAATGDGSLSTTAANPVVGIAETADGLGYWEVARDGEVAAFGDASSFGDLPEIHVEVSNIVAIAPTTDGKGYWLIGADGGMFAFGNAKYHGSLPGLGIRVDDVVGMVAAPSGAGYLVIGADGGVFAFGATHFFGSLPGIGVRVDDIVGILPAPAGTGYILVGSDGGAFSFGHGAPFHGSLPGEGKTVDDIVGIALTPDANGYWMAGANGLVYPFGDAENFAVPSGVAENLPVVAIAGT
jgi:RHS repeat-associated protein